eukprot:Rmarinus@m.26523
MQTIALLSVFIAHFVVSNVVSECIPSCDVNAVCTQDPSSSEYICKCAEFFYGNGLSCSQCGENAISEFGSTQVNDCACLIGYSGDPSTNCTAIRPYVYLQFDEGNGNSVVDLVSGDSFEIGGSSQWVPFGSGYALDFQGSAEIVLPAIDSINIDGGVSFLMWINSCPYVGPATVFFATSSDMPTYSIDLPGTPSQGTFLVGDDSFSFFFDSQGVDCVWTHWAFVKNEASGFLHVYQNGVLFEEDGNNFSPIPDADLVLLGSDPASIQRFSGILDDFRMYSRALNLEEINLFMNDFDECDWNPSSTCDAHADCYNTQGSFWCVCGTNYYGDGATCATCALGASAPYNSTHPTDCYCNS